jgi:hypothetical protein
VVPEHIPALEKSKDKFRRNRRNPHNPLTLLKAYSLQRNRGIVLALNRQGGVECAQLNSGWCKFMRIPSARQFTYVVLVLCIICSRVALAADEPAFSKDQIKHFLLTAKIIAAKSSSKGVTHPSRLTLSDGTVTHEASFQRVDEHKSVMKLESGAIVINFVDSYKYNIAGFAVAELLGLDDLVPVYVERKWQGQSGSLSWWLPVKMDGADMVARKIDPPDPEAWNKQMYRVRVFNELIYDSDANQTNLLIGPEWQIWRIDFTRAFRPEKDLKTPANLVRCDRQLLEKLKALKSDELMEKTHNYLTKDEVHALMVRRDKIVSHFETLAKQKGENTVLY